MTEIPFSGRPASPLAGARLPEEDRSYQQFWRTPSIHPWRIAFALLLGAAGALGMTLALMMVTVIIAPDAIATFSGTETTPLLFLVNNLSLASLILISIALSTALIGQPSGFMASVIGRIRWRWLFKCVVVLLPIWIVQQAVDLFLVTDIDSLAVNQNTRAMIIIILTTQVFQCAGEEYACRGVLNRIGGSLVRGELIGFLVGGVLSSFIFMLLHGAGDLWLNIFYFSFGMCAAWLTWRTGGLEAAIAMHCVNNLTAMAILPFSDVTQIFSRGEGTGSPWMLLNMAVMVGATALITWLGERENLVVRSAPGAQLQPFQAQPSASWPAPQLQNRNTDCQLPVPENSGESQPAAPLVGGASVQLPSEAVVSQQPATWPGEPAPLGSQAESDGESADRIR